jgi:chromosome segregation and condensation protein ScpB
MHKLPPTSIYRLRSLAVAGPRFYQVSGFMRRLEVLQLVAATGRTDPEARSVEYRITEAGHAELAERYEPDPPQHEGYVS